MILRKPYAFLIKHFKLLNLILCALMVYIVFKTNDILYFFTDYINAGYYIKIGDVVGDYINIQLYIILFFTLFINLAFIILLHVKEKSNMAYILLFVVYVVVTALVINGQINMMGMQVEVIDYRKVRLYKDILFISMFAQYISIIFTLIRGIGLNVKKFDFDKEIDELEVSSSDSAEFEVNININTNVFSRNMRRRRRYMRYFLKEHKNLFRFLGILFALSVAIITFINIGRTTLIKKENSAVKINENTIVVNKSFITEYDYSGKVINDKYSYVIVGFSIKNNGSELSNLESDNFKLMINNNIYSPIKTDESKLFDFGEYYKSNKLKPDTIMNYILVYKISKEEKNSKNIILRYNASQLKNGTVTDKNFDIKLNPVTYFSDKEISNAYLNSELLLRQSILGNTTIKIINYDINESYETSYDYCISKDVCEKIMYKVEPNDIDDNKIVLKLDVIVKYDQMVTSKDILDKSNLISKLGKIIYKTEDGKEKESVIENLTIDEIKSEDTIYLEVDDEILNSKSISLVLNIRGNKYTYILLDEQNA